MKKFMKITSLAILTIFAINILASSDTFATTKTWTGTAGDGLASTPSNWSPAGVPQTGDDLVVDDYVEFDLGVTVISSVTMNDCSKYISGDLVIAGSIISVGCDALYAGYLPVLSADITLAGDTIINGWEFIGPGVINMGNFNLKIVNVFSNTAGILTPANLIDVTGTGTLTVGREPSTSGLFMEPSLTILYNDDLDSLNLVSFVGTIEVVGWASTDANLLPGETVDINIRQDGLLGIVNFANAIGADEVVINSKINVLSSPSSGVSLAFSGNIRVPNITLYKSTTFLYGYISMFPFATAPEIDLTGINLNGFCIEYGTNDTMSMVSWDDGTAHFIGADMTECIETPGTTDPENPNVTDPDAPNTGRFALNDASLLIIAGVVSALIIGLAFKLHFARK